MQSKLSLLLSPPGPCRVQSLQTEEADDDKKFEKRKQYEEKQIQQRINAAVSNQNVRKKASGVCTTPVSL